MNSPITARRCYFPASSWVYCFILTADDQLAVWFKQGVHHYRGAAYGGVPGVCCLYPKANESHYELALVWGSAGKFVHQVLYKLLPYKLVHPPKLPCSGARTSTVVNSSPNPSKVGQAVTFTTTVRNLDGSAVPDVGAVEFWVDGVDTAAGSPLAVGGSAATSNWTTSNLSQGAHTVTAVYTGAEGFLNSQGQLQQTVNLTCRPLRGNTRNTSFNTTSVRIGNPGALDGDFMLLSLACQGPTKTVAAPNGWTLLDQSSNGILMTYLWSKNASSEPGSYTLDPGGPCIAMWVAWQGSSAVNFFARNASANGPQHFMPAVPNALAGNRYVAWAGLFGVVATGILGSPFDGQPGDVGFNNFQGGPTLCWAQGCPSFSGTISGVYAADNSSNLGITYVVGFA